MTLKRQCTPDLPNLAGHRMCRDQCGNTARQFWLSTIRSVIAVPYGVPVCRSCEAQSHPRPKTELDSNLAGRRVLEDLPRAFCDSADEKTRIAGSVWLTGGGGAIWLTVTYNY